MDNKKIPGFRLVESLYKDLIPDNTSLTIERFKLKKNIWYVYRLMYTSKNSGRTMCVIAKGQSFPYKRDDTFLFYLRQLVLEPKEVAREFSRLAFMERRARQDMFLSLGKLGNPRVASEEAILDLAKDEGYYR